MPLLQYYSISQVFWEDVRDAVVGDLVVFEKGHDVLSSAVGEVCRLEDDAIGAVTGPTTGFLSLLDMHVWK